MSDELKRTLTAKDVAVVAMGVIIGSGIFLTPGGVLASSQGYVGIAIGVWVVGGILTLLGALTYAELGCTRPGTGGLYVYIRDAFGPVWAFMYGWTLFLVIASGSVAALAVATGDNMAALFPGLSGAGKKVVAVVVLASLAFLNLRGTKQSTVVLTIATAAKALALVFLIVVLPFFGTGWSEVTEPLPAQWNSTLLAGGLLAMISVLWAYEGWQYATFIGGEVKDPQRNFPRGLVLGTLAIIAIYVLTNIGYVAGLGPSKLGVSTTVASDAVGNTFGPTAARLITIPVLISIISAAHALILTASRVFYAMARDGIFFKKLGEVHPRFGTPANSIIAIATWGAVLAMSGTFSILLTYVVFIGWIFYGLGGLSVIVFRKREPDAPRPFKVPLYPITPILFVLSAVVIVLNTVVSNPMRGVIGLGGVLIGLPVYFWWKRSNSPVA